MFIVFEGIDGSGKTTVSKLFAERLKERGRDVLWTNEPNSDTKFGLDIRDILKKHETKLDNLTELLLFSASRVEHIKNVIEPALKENKTVISDRYYYSTIAYQGFAGNMKENILSAVNGAVFTKFPIYPNIVFWIDADIDTCMQRSKKTDAKDMMSREYYELCREYYSHLYNNRESYENSRIIRIDGNQALSRVVEDVMREYSKHCFKESIHLRVAAVDICQLFENLLDTYNITIPCEDRKGDENEARIYGVPYYDLVESVANMLYDLWEKVQKNPDIELNCESY